MKKEKEENRREQESERGLARRVFIVARGNLE